MESVESVESVAPENSAGAAASVPPGSSRCGSVIGGTVSPAMRRASARAASMPICRCGCATVASAGDSHWPIARPSKPITLRSSGTRRPRMRRARMVSSASRSLLQNTAVGRGGASRRSSSAGAMASALKSISTGGCGTMPAACNASR
ncbi:hypothetical protein KR96_24080 [Ralstonia solanacearum]|nr:hypothetical protein KR96_24080 [Ralstonia solanacearum]